MGIGLYLYFPVFYADVSSIWRLKKQERMVVNLGGIYFQLFLLLPLTLLNIYQFNFVLTIAIFFNYLSILYNLNPIFKFDGYWIVSDWLGIPNLRDRSKELLGYAYAKYLRGKKHLPRPYLLNMKKQKRNWLALYTSVSIIFFSYIFFFRLPQIIWSFIERLPGQLVRLGEVYHDWYHFGHAFDWTFFWQFFTSLLIFLLCLYLILRLLLKATRKRRPLVNQFG